MRKPYQWGAKQYLAGFNIGEERVYNDRFPWRSLQQIASRNSKRFGYIFRFYTKDDVKHIMRLQ